MLRNYLLARTRGLLSQGRRPALLVAAIFVPLLLSGCAWTTSRSATENGTPSPREQRANRNQRGGQRRPAHEPAQSSAHTPPVTLGALADPDIRESSGLAAARSAPGYFWTHNDSGDGPFLFALDRRGRRAGVWRVTGAAARDWEDMAVGPGPAAGRSYLYIGDMGDNARRRDSVVVYRIEEPVIEARDTPTSKRNPATTAPAAAIRLRYPDGAHDAEALLVHPTTGDLYIITKAPGRPAGIYKASAPLATTGTTTLRRIGDMRLMSLMGSIITGGDISPDGRRVALCDYFQGYELSLPDGAQSFDDIWQQPLAALSLGERRQGEAIAYSLDGQAILATSEGRPAPLIEVRRR